MGQATVDLPDSLDPPPATAASTDDLLAQLASDEIDRLLAEADGEGAAALKSAKAGSPPKLVEPIDSIPISFDEGEPDAPSKAPPAAAQAPASIQHSDPDAEVSTQINELFAQFDQNPASAATTDAAPPEPAIERRNPIRSPAMGSGEASAPTATAKSPPLDHLQNDDQTSAAERGALDTSGAAAAAGEIDAALSAADPPSGFSLFLRPLELISTPLNSCSQEVRDIIGKIAILTAVNAISILVYVLFFRRH
jgi:hypothetical protein